MYRLLLILVAGILLFPSCKSPLPEDPLNTRLEQEPVQRDFRLFRDILEKGHPALTEYISEKRKDFLFDSVYRTIEKQPTLRSFYNKLSFLIDELGCSHTAAALPAAVIDTLYNRKLFFPFPVVLLDGNMIANSDNVVPHGTKILSVNNIPVTRLLDSLMMYQTIDGFHRETQKYLACSDFSFDYFARFGGCKKFDLLVKDTTGAIRTIFPDAIDFTEVNERQRSSYYYDAMDVPYSLYINNDNHYGLLRVTSFEFESGNQQNAFENFLVNSFELLRKKKNITTLIIDIRENTGGDLYNCFLLNSYLCREPFSEYKSVSSRIEKIPYPELLSEDFDRKKLRSINKRLKEEFIRDKDVRLLADSLIGLWIPDENRFLNDIVIITNPRVVSSASYFTLLAKTTAGAKVIGVETSGGNFSGNGFSVLPYTLPYSKIRLYFAYAKLIYSNGSPEHGHGIIPDYIVPDSYESFKNNRDQQLDFIVDSLILKNK